ncbi:DNL-type zinc finger protein [Aplysia californica]|uniref:DNL-type zinc finger protein n=1 Tax=Aplysia californica TaxID=6500 RepID=A0ABM0K323_APLCA|nr:DNL-type zinc finger protein [Aplysia californica]
MSVFWQVSRHVYHQCARTSASLSRFVGSRQYYTHGINPVASQIFLKKRAKLVAEAVSANRTRLFSTSWRHLVSSSDGKKRVGAITPRLAVSYKCNICGNRNTQAFSKKAYEEGVVIVKCETCQSNHLMADNLGWFKDVNKRNIEEILAAKGEEVKKLSSFDIPREILEKLDSTKEE